MKRFGVIGWALLVCGVLAPGCGAGSAETLAPPARASCPSLDDHLEGLYELVESGGLSSLSEAIGDVNADLQADLVRTLLDLIGAFEPGTFSALDELGGAVGAAGTLPQSLADVLDFIANDGPGAPYGGALEAVQRLLQSCDGPPVLELLKSLLEDTALLDGLSTALDAIDISSAVDGLEVDGNEGRMAVRALVRNLLVAASRDDFDVNALIDLLAFVVDTTEPPFDALVDALRSFLAPGPSLDAVQGLLNCLQDSDPELALIDLLLDIVTSDALTLLDDLAASGNSVQRGVGAGLSNLLGAALDVLIADPAARRALADVLVALVSSEAFGGLLTDLATLLRADLLGDVVRALSSLATRSCDEPVAADGL